MVGIFAAEERHATTTFSVPLRRRAPRHSPLRRAPRHSRCLSSAAKMPTIQPCNISFDMVAREWRCKYTADASGGPAESASLKAAEELLQSYLPTLKALPGA